MAESAATGSAATGAVDVPAVRGIALITSPVSLLDIERMHAIVKAKERGPRPGEVHREILQCVDCRKFMTYDKFYVTLPARECIVCKDAFWGTQRMGPLPPLQPPAPEVTPLQPPARKETDENIFAAPARRKKKDRKIQERI